MTKRETFLDVARFGLRRGWNTLTLYLIYFGSSDKLVPGFMNSEDFEFGVFHISVSISASFEGFDFIV